MGWTVVERDGQAEVTVWRQRDDVGLYKAYLRGATGRFLLGTLVPEGERLSVRRVIAVSRLRTCGAWPAIGADTPLEFAFPREKLPDGWHRQAPPPLCDPVLRAAADGRDGWVLRGADGFQLAYAYGGNRPFPIAPLFCLARLVTLGEGEYIVYHFSNDGTPLV